MSYHTSTNEDISNQVSQKNKGSNDCDFIRFFIALRTFFPKRLCPESPKIKLLFHNRQRLPYRPKMKANYVPLSSCDLNPKLEVPLTLDRAAFLQVAFFRFLYAEI